MTLSRLLVSLLCTAPAWSAVVYTNIGAGDVYTSSYTIYAGSFVAAEFKPAETGVLDTISMQLARNGFALPPDLVISLRGPDDDPNAPVIESWIVAPVDISAPPGTLEVLQSSLHPFLSGGKTYWLRAESSGPFPFQSYGWAQNVTGDAGPAAVSSNAGVSWTTAGPNPAFVVTTVQSAVPEPASSAFLTLGLLVLMLRRAAL
jgi:hypothetical protein